jgi:hypothetical protein
LVDNPITILPYYVVEIEMIQKVGYKL